MLAGARFNKNCTSNRRSSEDENFLDFTDLIWFWGRRKARNIAETAPKLRFEICLRVLRRIFFLHQYKIQNILLRDFLIRISSDDKITLEIPSKKSAPLIRYARGSFGLIARVARRNKGESLIGIRKKQRHVLLVECVEEKYTQKRNIWREWNGEGRDQATAIIAIVLKPSEWDVCTRVKVWGGREKKFFFVWLCELAGWWWRKKPMV